MKRYICAAAIAILCSTAAFGQAGAVSLQNQEDVTFYYVVDPPELADITAGSPLLQSRVADYFASASDTSSFIKLAPQAEASVDKLTPGTHLLVGFFAQQDQDQFPVRVLSLQVDNSAGERFYALFADSPQLTVSRGVGRLMAFAAGGGQGAAAPTAAPAATTATASGGNAAAPANSASAAAPAARSPAQLATIAAYAASYAPDYFTKEQKGAAFDVLPIAESRAWSLTGTEVTQLSGSLDAQGLRLSLSVPAGFSENVSYFFYIFGSREAGKENALTLELQPRANGSRGACLLWEKGVDIPRLIGTVTTGSGNVELDIGGNELNSDILSKAGSSATVDFTASWFDRALGTWEEFSYATFSVSALSARG